MITVICILAHMYGRSDSLSQPVHNCLSVPFDCAVGMVTHCAEVRHKLLSACKVLSTILVDFLKV